MLGRVSSLDWLISIGLLPVSFALTGPAAALVGARATLIGAGTLGALVTVSALLLPGMLDVQRAVPTAPRLPESAGPRAARADSEAA